MVNLLKSGFEIRFPSKSESVSSISRPVIVWVPVFVMSMVYVTLSPEFVNPSPFLSSTSACFVTSSSDVLFRFVSIGLSIDSVIITSSGSSSGLESS